MGPTGRIHQMVLCTHGISEYWHAKIRPRRCRIAGCAENDAVVALRPLRRVAEAPERWAAAARAVRRAPRSASSRRAASAAGTASCAPGGGRPCTRCSGHTTRFTTQSRSSSVRHYGASNIDAAASSGTSVALGAVASAPRSTSAGLHQNHLERQLLLPVLRRPRLGLAALLL